MTIQNNIHHPPQKTVLVVGVFDMFHRGHLELLRSAAAIGDKLVVLVNGDTFTEQYKRKPLIPETDRLEIVKAIKWVTSAELTNSPDVKPFIEKYNIDTILHGDDWDHDSYLRQIQVTEDYISKRRIRMIYTAYYEGVSTSSLISQIRDSDAI